MTVGKISNIRVALELVVPLDCTTVVDSQALYSPYMYMDSHRVSQLLSVQMIRCNHAPVACLDNIVVKRESSDQC